MQSGRVNAPVTKEATLDSKDFNDLVEQIKGQNDGAMCQLVKVYGPTMERIAEKLIGPALQAQLDPADIVQNVQVTLWVGIRSGRFSVPTPHQFLALAKTLLQRRIARYWRKVKLEMASTVDGKLLGTISDDDLSGLFNVTKNDQALDVDEILERFLSRVDETDRQLIRMRFLGYTTAEAAQALQLDAGFLRVRLGRLRRRFANLWPHLELEKK
jgi:RNA polymerase sigma factor (sigma-70 family)